LNERPLDPPQEDRIELRTLSNHGENNEREKKSTIWLDHSLVFSHLPLDIFLARPEKARQKMTDQLMKTDAAYRVLFTSFVYFYRFLMLFLLVLLCVYLPPMMMKITIRLVILAIIATSLLTSST